MCGLAGVAPPAGADGESLLEAVRRMVARLRHRGPDDEGIVALPRPRPRILLGATRLAILDPTPAGHQPFEDPETGDCLALNGEIYNHVHLRRELPTPAGGWRSRSDTETVLRAYAHWGIGCLERLRGMFALALWDQSEEVLLCARDPLGIKPLYYASTPHPAFVFASEVRALLASGLIDRRLDIMGLAGFVRLGSVPEPRTLIAGVESLPAGHWMRVRAGRVAETGCYFRLMPRGQTPAEGAPQIRRVLECAVRDHLLSDVPVAAFLSGGLDSSVLTALAARASQRRLLTVTVGLGDAELDESVAAASFARHAGTEHIPVRLSDEEGSAAVEEAVLAMDLPSADGPNTFVVSRAAARAGVKVALSGLGGDELFGGYRTFRILRLLERWAWLLKPAAPLAGLVRRGSRARILELATSGAALSERYETLRAFWALEEIADLGLPSVGYGLEEPPVQLSASARVSILELTGYLRSTLLRDADSMSMASSLELRVPFLDLRLVETCLSLDAARARGGPKRLLRDAAADLLGSQAGRGPKRGFVLPMARWMRGPLEPFVALGLKRLSRSELLAGMDLAGLNAGFRAGRLPWARLWQFAVLGHWIDSHLS